MRSRRDLVRLNAVMRQPALMARALAAFPAPKVLADLGGGDGRFLLAVARRLHRRWPGVRAVICDRQDILADETRAAFAALGWRCELRRGDIFETMPQADIVMANLFLHHFQDDMLACLLAQAAQAAPGFAACEPRRGRFALMGAKMSWALGCNGVTRHDAAASVRAGFRDLELAALWPQDAPGRRWRLTEGAGFLFSHVFSARAF